MYGEKWEWPDSPPVDNVQVADGEIEGAYAEIQADPVTGEIKPEAYQRATTLALLGIHAELRALRIDVTNLMRQALGGQSSDSPSTE